MKDHQIFWVSGRLPSLNKIVKAAKAHWSAYAKFKSQNTDAITWTIKSNRIEPIGPGRRFMIEFGWVLPMKGKLEDPDNIAAAKKFILDALVNAGIIPDDSFAYIAGFTDSFRRVGDEQPWYVPRPPATNRSPPEDMRIYPLTDVGVMVSLYAIPCPWGGRLAL